MGMELVAVVTGGTSGIGKCAALALAGRGCKVYSLSRRGGDVPGVRCLSCDVTDEGSIQRAVAQILQESGRIDLLVNNAGFGISGAVEFTKTEDAKRLMDVNFWGMVRMNRAVLPLMRRQGGGRIVHTSSIAAPVPIPFQAYYSATKAAVNAYCGALRAEVQPFGIQVCAVMPGDIATGFTVAREKSAEGDDIYAGRIARSVAVMEKDELGGMPPERVGRFIARVALRQKLKPLYAIGFSYRCVIALTHLLPVSLVNRIVGFLYAR